MPLLETNELKKNTDGIPFDRSSLGVNERIVRDFPIVLLSRSPDL